MESKSVEFVVGSDSIVSLTHSEGQHSSFAPKRQLAAKLPMSWMSIKLAGQFKVPASERKIWSYKIKQSSQLCVCFPNLLEMAQDKKMCSCLQKFPWGSYQIIRLSTIILVKYYNLTSTLNLVHGIRN